MSDLVVTRFAPSPTGDLHLGGARTALFSYALARRHGGRFVLRVEDTDVARNSEESADRIFEAMRWLGLDWDGPALYQSRLHDRHRAAMTALAGAGLAYPAFDTQGEIAAMRAAGGNGWTYNGASRVMSVDEGAARVAAGETHVWRLRTPDSGSVTILDAIRGEVSFPLAAMSDPVIWRSSGDAPLYNLACAVDDVDAGVTHIIRGEEHLTNAAIQSLIRSGLGAPAPVWAHLPVVTRNGKKMSKRDPVTRTCGPVGVLGRRDMGWLAEGVLNHISLLGWSRPDPEAPEFFSLDEFVSEFDLGRVRRSPSNFDEKKASSVQKFWMASLPDHVISARAEALTGEKVPSAVVAAVSAKSRDLRQLVDLARPMSSRPPAQEVSADLTGVADLLDASDVTPSWQDIVDSSPEVPARELAAALRKSLTGSEVSADLVTIIAHIGAREASSRIRASFGVRPNGSSAPPAP